MNITSAEFVKGIMGTDDILYDGVPQVAFVGRSNVGKSSLINTLTGKKDLVKVGAKPGKTTEINFFALNGRKLYFVDLPGYGYAKVSPEKKEKLKKLILWYLMFSEVKPLAVVLVLDAKAGLTDFDREMIETLREAGHRFIIALNKTDKLNQSELAERLRSIKEAAGEEAVPVSAETRRGMSELLQKVVG